MRNARAVATGLLLLAGCAHAPPWQEIKWPSPPETPRVKFVRAFRRAADVDTTGWGEFRRTFLGRSSTEVEMFQPMGLAISDDGQRVYVADLRSGKVLRADLAAKRLEDFGKDAAFGMPFNVALDEQENVYVSDSASRSITVLDRGGKKLLEFGARELARPTGLALDRARRVLYVTDLASGQNALHRVAAYDLGGKYLRDVGNGRGSGDGEFNFPSYLALDADGNLYVSDTLNFRVQVFGADGQFLRKYGAAGDTPGAFGKIKGIAVDGLGIVYVADGEHGVVQLFSRDFQPLMWFGGKVNKLEYMDIPSAIAVDPRTNTIYVGQETTPRVNVYQLINTGPADVPEPEGAASAGPTPSAPSAEPASATK